ncbi:MAG: TonB-dependent receptor [Alphaproteobacteria bacterium]|nr:TonB-dependent receptor [Alphaproteobacteria bacterium]
MMGVNNKACAGNRGMALAAALMVTTALVTPFAVSPALAQQSMAAAPKVAQLQGEQNFDIPAQPLTDALVAFGQQSGVQVTVDGTVARDVSAPAVQGTMTSEQALRQLLAGSGLIYTMSGSTVAIERPAVQGADGTIVLDPVTVEGQTGTMGQAQIGNLPPAYPGGQVARGGHMGLLGNQDVFDTPFSVTSYTSELIENQQAKTIADVVQNDSSAYSINAERSPTNTIAIRGFNTGGNGGPLYDGMDGLSHRRFSTVENLERVEIFKGANSLLTGAVGRVGGTVNLVPKRPLETSLTQLTATYEPESRGGLQVDVSRRFGADDKFGARFNGVFQDGESVPENNADQLKEASLAMDFRSDAFRTSVILDYSGRELEAANQLFNNVVSVPDAPDTGAAVQQPWEVTNNDFIRGLVRMEYDFAEHWMVHGALGATDFDGSFLRTTGAGLTGSGDFTQTAREQRDVESNVSGSLGVKGQFVTASVTHQLSFETTRVETESGRDRQNIAGYSITSNIYNPVFTSRPGYTPLSGSVPTTNRGVVESTAVADVLGFFDDRALLTLGVRNQRVSADNISATTGLTTSSYDESELTPAIGLVIKPQQSFSVYGNYIESLEQGATAPSTASNAGEVFAPAVTKQMEFGVKYDMGKLGVTAGVFQLEQPSGFTDASNTFSIDGEQRNRGVELSAFGQVTPDVRLLGGVTYLDAELIKTQNGTNDGNKAVGVPEFAAVLGMEWDTPFVDGLTLSARGNHMGGQYIDSGNTKKIESYNLFSIGARYEQKIEDQDFIFRANVSNLFDEDYWITFPGGSNLLYYGAPRVISLSATMEF